MRARIYLVVGPSGAGKDTLLIGARKELSDDDDVVFIRRDITRENVTEMETHVTEERYETNLARNQYVFAWSSHGTKYGIPTRALTSVLEEKNTAVLNVSRTQISAVRSKFGATCDIYVLYISASLTTLRHRLKHRGRDGPAAIEARLRRALIPIPDMRYMIRIINESSVEDGVQRVCEALLGAREIRSPADYYFDPHISLYYGNAFSDSEKVSIIRMCLRSMPTTPQTSITLTATKLALVCTSGKVFRSWPVVLEGNLRVASHVHDGSTRKRKAHALDSRSDSEPSSRIGS